MLAFRALSRIIWSSCIVGLGRASFFWPGSDSGRLVGVGMAFFGPPAINFGPFFQFLTNFLAERVTFRVQARLGRQISGPC